MENKKIRRKSKKVKSIFRKLFVPIICVMILQSCIFYFSAVHGGITDILCLSAQKNMENKVSERGGKIEALFTDNWSDMSEYANSFNQIYEKYKKESDVPMYENEQMQEKYLEDVSDILITMLRNNEVNGVFLILNNNKELVTLDEEETQVKKGLCIRDYDQDSAYIVNEDLTVIRCPESIISGVGCEKEIDWESDYVFNKGDDAEYYFRPLSDAYKGYYDNWDDAAYISSLHSYSDNDEKVVSYSVCLQDCTGYPYGVLGIELTEEYLTSLMPYNEIGNSSGYMLVKYDEDSKKSEIIAYNGNITVNESLLKHKINNSLNSENEFFCMEENNKCVCASVTEIYSGEEDTRFADSRIKFVGLLKQDELYFFQKNIRVLLLFDAVIGLIIGGVAIFFVSRYFSKPITGLAGKVQKMKPEPDFHLERLGIAEIDQLVTSIEAMSHNISEGKARTEFFSRMSHDMRTPMNAIISFSSQEMLADATEPEKEDYLHKINISAQYLLGLINEVLDMTKIDSGKMELHEENISLQKLWSSNASIIGNLAANKNIEFKMVVPSAGVSYIIGDFQRLSQIMVNLLSNAVKFTEPGGHVTFTFMIIDVTSTMLSYCMLIKDDGIGMSEEFQERLYEPFVRGNTKQEGTGLGLAITKQLVELMGGKIECISRLGEGTEFLVYLNNRIGSKTMEEEETEPVDEAKILEGKRILLCEDHKINCQIATRLLQSRKMIVEVAGDGKEGLDKFTQSEIGYYDAILMDIRMPVMDGLKASMEIRKLSRDDAETIPIIAMTANAFEDDIKETREAGMNAHLSKPIEPDKLFATLAKLLM